MEDATNLGNKYRSAWTKVKFFAEKPNIETAKKLSNIRFCEAISEAQRTHSLILDRSSISCPGAKYVFGWDKNTEGEIVRNCVQKWGISDRIMKSILGKVSTLPPKINYIGLNIEGDSDVLISYLQPEQFMRMLRVYQNKTGERMEVSLSSVMSVCGVAAVEAYVKGKISISFGCEDSRSFGGVSRDRLVVGIPTPHLHIFTD